MASKREAKKKIKGEYKKLEEDILQYLKVGTDIDSAKANEMLEELKHSRDAFVKELNSTEEATNELFNDLFKRVVDDVDKKYKALKGLVTK